jgi:rhomboid protease GluP
MKLVRTFLSSEPRASGVFWATSVLILMFILTGCGWTSIFQSDLLTASREEIFQSHEYWRLFTTTAMHADAVHFFSNALFFWIFAYFLNGYFGAWIFPTLCIFAGALINFATLYFYTPESILLGASGVVYFMAAFWITLFFLIERGRSIAKRLLISTGVSLALFFPSTFEPHVSYLAHAFGFGFGITAGAIYFLLRRDPLRRAEVWKTLEPESSLESPLETSDESAVFDETSVDPAGYT